MREHNIEFFSMAEGAVCRSFPTREASLRGLLKEGTRSAHERLETLLALGSPDLTLPAYVRFLRVMHAWHAAIEPRLESSALRVLGIDMRPRAKRAWLESDLAHFDACPAEPVRLCLPALETGAALLGSAYVLEGATLGGAVLFPAISRRWNLGPSGGATYLYGRGGETGSAWKGFVEVLDAAPLDEAGRLECVESARATFTGLAESFAPGRA